MTPTRQDQADVAVVSHAQVGGLTLVQPLVTGREVGDEEVGLTAGRVEEGHASFARVTVISLVVLLDLTRTMARGDPPDHVEQL